MPATTDQLPETARIARWQRPLLPGGLLLGQTAGSRSPRDWGIDVLMFLIAIGIGATVLGQTWSDHSGTAIVIDIAFGCLACVSLWWRRSRPVAVGLFAGLLAIVSACAAGAALLALFSAAIRVSLRMLVMIASVGLVGSVVFPILYPGDEPLGTDITIGVLLTSIMVGWGLFVRAQRDLVLSLHETARQSDEQQRLRVEQAREGERLRIAREMHDALAHRVSLLSVQAGALEYRPDATPQEIEQATGVIRATAHAALQDLRDVLGVLREGTDQAVATPQSPQPTFARIPALIEESRASGMKIALDLRLPDGASNMLGHTTYRILQEGLTNARKHAPGAAVNVTVGPAPEDGVPSHLTIELVSRRPVGADRRKASQPGVGLVGLAERVTLAGGEMTAGLDADGDFVLRAKLPWSTA
ncbi:MAG TPA: histidine kinase [Baekduia sp.]|nr:histidine kinase [Baekduia sp.]